MTSSFIRSVPAVLALGIASIGFSASAQTPPPPATAPMTAPAPAPMTAPAPAPMAAPAVAPQPTLGDKVANGSKKAYNSTKHTAKKAGHATKRVAKKSGNAVANVGHKAANGMRTAGHKIGEKIPGTAENAALKK
jgi:hypothetical protein